MVFKVTSLLTPFMQNPFERPKYLEKFGLKEAPYTTNPDERYLFLTDAHNEAIQMSARIIQNKEGAGLTVGEKGTGKTTIMRRIISLLSTQDNFKVAVIETAGHSPTPYQLVKEILESFEVTCVGRDTKTRNDQLKEFLLINFKTNKTCVLLIDEAQQLSAKLLEALRGYLNFETPRGGKLLQILLFAMPNINRRLPYAPSLRNRLVKTILKKMDRNETEDMLRWRFQQAGGKLFPFEEEAIDTLFKLSQGNPRTICGISQLALELSASRNQTINSKIIKEVSKTRFLT